MEIDNRTISEDMTSWSMSIFPFTILKIVLCIKFMMQKSDIDDVVWFYVCMFDFRF